jgi:hypothetical protein
MGTLLKKQSPITVYSLLTKKNKLPFSVSVCGKQTEVCHFCYWFAANNEKLHTYTQISNAKQKTESQAIFLNPFTVCSSCKRKFVVCPFVHEVTNGSLKEPTKVIPLQTG